MKLICILPLFLAISIYLCGQENIYEKIGTVINENYSDWESLYKHLHQNPELSYQEFETSERMARELKNIGFTVTKNVGGNGVVGILKNGDGPVVMVRADMDAIPVHEQTGSHFASTKKVNMPNGKESFIMHACGHDMHMTVFTGTAKTLKAISAKWNGTLMFVAQPAEEKHGGATNMLKDGLFTKFPKPDYALALHVSPEIESGKVGIKNGAIGASIDNIDITVYGEGGHGAYPHKTVDPVVLASRAVLAFQTIASREVSPLEPIVLTVGSINGGVKHNIIPGEVKLQLTLRAYSDEVRQHALDAINRICKGLAISAGLPESKYPKIEIEDNPLPCVINNDGLAAHLHESFGQILGKENVITVKPVMAGEDFGRYGRTAENIPIAIWWLGTVSEEKMKEHKTSGKKLPPLHSPYFLPDTEKTIKTGVKAMSKAVFDLLGN